MLPDKLVVTAGGEVRQRVRERHRGTWKESRDGQMDGMLGELSQRANIHFSLDKAFVKVRDKREDTYCSEGESATHRRCGWLNREEVKRRAK